MYDHGSFKKAKGGPGWHIPINIDGGQHGQVIHVVHCNEQGEPLWDQIMRAEIGGGCFLPVVMEKGLPKFGLQKMERPQAIDNEKYRSEFPKIDLTNLGRVGWEIPRGFANMGDKSGAETATREAQEETQSVVTSSDTLALVCDNTAMHPHLTTITMGQLDLSKKPVDKPDRNEKIVGKIQFFTPAQLAQMIREGVLYDGFTLTAISLYVLLKCKIA